MLPADEKALEHSKSGSRDPDIVYGAQNRSDAVQPTTTLEYDNKEANASAERVDSIAMTTAEKPEPEPAGVSWRLKCLILICMLAVPVGSHYLEATMGTLKTSLKHTMHINNTQFSILMSAVTLVGTVLPLFAGILVDDLSGVGSIRATTIISFVIFVGAFLVSIAAIRLSYPLMVAGQVIYGLGGGMIVTMQEAILARWFRDKQLSIVVGLVVCIARLVKWAAKMACYNVIRSAGGQMAWAIHVATILCGAGVVANCIYWVALVRYGWATASGKEISRPHEAYSSQLPEDQEPTTPANILSRRNTTATNLSDTRLQSSSFKYSVRLFFFVPSTFWMVPWMQLCMSSVLSSFEDIATEFVQFRFKTDSIMAGYQSSLTQVVPIVVAPLMGVVIHRYGKRLWSLLGGAIILVASLAMLAYSWAAPAAGMILFSSALALGPIGVLTSAPLLLPQELAGTGMGLHKIANNVGTTIVSILVGYVQDLTYHDGNPHDDTSDLGKEYDGVMILYMVLACISVLGAMVFWVMDRRMLSGWLQATKKERDHRVAEVSELQQQPYRDWERIGQALRSIGCQLRRRRSFVYVGIFGFWLVVSWAVFFAFALMPLYQNYSS